MENKNLEIEQKEKERALIAQKTKIAEEIGLILPKNLGDQVINSLTMQNEEGKLFVPQDYHLGNALKLAYMKIQGDNKLANCDNASKANAMLNMAVLGLSVAKQQCYFVPYGNQCTLMTSYFGKICALKRIKGVKNVIADVIYKDTQYILEPNEWGQDGITITGVCPLEKRQTENIVGAWCKIILDEEIYQSTEYTVVMPINEIQASWGMGASKGNSIAHKNFGGEMAKKSVINRAQKMFTNISSDSDLISKALNEVVAAEYEAPTPPEKEVKFEVIEEEVIIETKIDENPKPRKRKAKEKVEEVIVEENIVEETIVEEVVIDETEINEVVIEDSIEELESAEFEIDSQLDTSLDLQDSIELDNDFDLDDMDF